MAINLEEYAGSSEFPVIDGGEYEVVLKLERKNTKDGSKEFINLDFAIREDVEQPFNHSKAHVFDKAWPDTQNPSWFDLKKLGSILVTQKNLPGYHADFADVDECILFLNGAHLRITVEKNYDDYYGKEQNTVKYLSYKPSKWDAEPHAAPSVAPTLPTDQDEATSVLERANEAAKAMLDPSVKDKLPF